MSLNGSAFVFVGNNIQEFLLLLLLRNQPPPPMNTVSLICRASFRNRSQRSREMVSRCPFNVIKQWPLLGYVRIGMYMFHLYGHPGQQEKNKQQQHPNMQGRHCYSLTDPVIIIFPSSCSSSDHITCNNYENKYKRHPHLTHPHTH